MKNKRLAIASWLLCLAISSVSVYPAPSFTARSFGGKPFTFKQFWRTELYFGTEKPDGAAVSDAEWEDFLAREITPRFPDGLTVVEGYGQFHNAAGKIVREKSRVLILLYPRAARKSSHRKIEQIRRAYMRQFQQQALLRVDFRQPVGVSF
jgi:hypothetical protein